MFLQNIVGPFVNFVAVPRINQFLIISNLYDHDLTSIDLKVLSILEFSINFTPYYSGNKVKRQLPNYLFHGFNFPFRWTKCIVILFWQILQCRPNQYIWIDLNNFQYIRISLQCMSRDQSILCAILKYVVLKFKN